MTNQESVQASVARIRREVSNREQHYYNLEGFKTRLPDTLTIGKMRDLERLLFEHISANGFMGDVDKLVLLRFGVRYIEFHVREDTSDTPYRAAGRLDLESAIAWLHAVQRAREPLHWDRELIVGVCRSA